MSWHCPLVSGCQYIPGLRCLHLQGQAVLGRVQWRHHDPLQHRQRLTWWHSATSRATARNRNRTLWQTTCCMLQVAWPVSFSNTVTCKVVFCELTTQDALPEWITWVACCSCDASSSSPPKLMNSGQGYTDCMWEGSCTKDIKKCREMSHTGFYSCNSANITHREEQECNWWFFYNVYSKNRTTVKIEKYTII
jgi:hypothetical protein